VDNDVHNTRPNGESGGDAYAIYLAGVRDAVVVNNRITDASIGIFGQGPAPTWEVSGQHLSRRRGALHRRHRHRQQQLSSG
jgi:hypothetical protein